MVGGLSQCVPSLQTKAHLPREATLYVFNQAGPAAVQHEYMYQKRGPQYHWVVELFERLKLPVFKGVEAALEAFNEQRKLNLDCEKTDSSKQGEYS